MAVLPSAVSRPFTLDSKMLGLADKHSVGHLVDKETRIWMLLHPLCNDIGKGKGGEG